MKIPEAVLKQAKDLIKQYGSHFVFLGEMNGVQVFVFQFPEGSFTGYPFVYCYDGKNALEITGEAALENIALFDNVE